MLIFIRGRDSCRLVDWSTHRDTSNIVHSREVRCKQSNRLTGFSGNLTKLQFPARKKDVYPRNVGDKDYGYCLHLKFEIYALKVVL